MFYKKNNNGEIIAVSNKKFDEDFEETEKNIVEGFDHKLYFEEDTFSASYISRQQEYLRKVEINKSIKQLENWFENYFDKQLKQSLWQEDFKPSYDSILERQYENLNELKEQAQEIRETIKELRLELA